MPLVSKSEALSEGDIRLKISFEENRRAASGEILALGLLLVAATLVASAPALLPGHNLVGHDILFHLNRIEGIKEGLLSGQFPVRLDVNCIRGYGMPTGIFYPSLFVLYRLYLLLEASPKAISGRTSYLRVRLEFHLYPHLILKLFNAHRFGPPRNFTCASTWTWVDHCGFGSTYTN